MRLVALLALAIWMHIGSAGAADVTVGTLTVSSPWTRATPAGAKVAGGFMKITNAGKDADRLIGGSLPLAGVFQVHEMALDGGVMTMRELAKGLEIKAGATVELKPGSYHVMFMGLKEPIKDGAPLKGTLVFERAGKIDVEYKVEPLGSKAAPEHHGHR